MPAFGSIIFGSTEECCLLETPRGKIAQTLHGICEKAVTLFKWKAEVEK